MKRDRTMKQSLSARDFAGTQIKTPFEKMRANAIVNAKYDTCGLSIISFNVFAFLQHGKSQDAHHLLCRWAVEPIRRNPSKFIKYPEAGYSALIKRVMKLDRDLAIKQNIPDWFAERATAQMRKAVDDAMYDLRTRTNDKNQTDLKSVK